ncbi:MAG: cell division protein FtsL [Candidatus Sungbacteria bacterium]|nr:cell division protein FtsL [Candidatus Sungbacteria bacterium]
MWKTLKNSIIVNIIIITLAVFLSISAYRTVKQAFVVREQTVEERKQIEELKNKKEELEAYLVELQTKEAIEREAKAELNLKLPGEEVVVVVPEKKENIPEEPTRATLWDSIKIWFNK